MVPPPDILHIAVAYRRWDGPELPWREDFGKAGGQVYPLDGGPPERSCNEVEVAKLLRTVRDEAYWVSNYSADLAPSIWRPWILSPDSLPEWLRQLDSAVRERVADLSGGLPDVVAWNRGQPLASAVFVECKAPAERFKEGQEDWVSAAIHCGVTPDRVAVAVRVFG